MTNNKLTPVTVYVPTDVNVKTLEAGKIVSASFDNGKTFPYEAMGKNWPSNELGYTHWLDPQERYIFSKEELEILLNNTFKAGCDYADNFDRNLESGEKVSEPDNVSYIQSLF